MALLRAVGRKARLPHRAASFPTPANPQMSAPLGVPARLSSFVGRKKEMGEVRRLLPHTRVATLVGPGGCAQTRLAIEFARQQGSRFEDGSILVELASVRDPAMVANAIAAAAGLSLTAEDSVAELVSCSVHT